MEVLERLKEGLPDAYTLFHSVDWMRPSEAGTAHGEIDIAVVNQAGDLLLIEVKGGQVDCTPQGIFKTYRGGQVRNVANQVGLQYGSIRKRLNEMQLQVVVHQLLVLPHMNVEGETAQWPRERIVDAAQYPHLASQIKELLGPGEWNGQAHDAIVRFLSNHFRVRVDVTSVLRQAEHTTSVLSSGLATWVPRIHSAEGIYRINATAGSGKTQLALQLLNSAAADGLKAAYFCFNSPLAAVVARRVRPTVQAQTFHHYARQLYERLGHQADFTQPGIFARMSAVAAEYLASPSVGPDLDLLVMDEMQDMEPQWAQALIHRLKPGARAYLFEDTDQLLYADRKPFSVGGEVTITCTENARSPQTIIRLINELRLTQEPIQGLNPYLGTVAEPRVYRNTEELMAMTVGAVKECLDMGFTLKDVAVLSWRGRDASQVLKAEKIGQWATSRATGQRDADGEELFTQGDLLCESVHRFKGQATGAVVLTEMEMAGAPIDDSDADAQSRYENHWHRVYVGMTRAQGHVGMVMSVDAERAMVLRLTS
jgi:predicted RecB family endonuclease